MEDAREELLSLRTREGAWGYRKDRSPSVEATALACLGLLGSPSGPGREPEVAAAERGARWLTTMQQEEGSLGAAPGLPEVGWATPYAVLLWNSLRLFVDRREQAAGWLLRCQGETPAPDSSSRLVVAHNPRLRGWPWTEGTHSWVEPTALAILALCIEGLDAHPRVLEGRRLILDRALPHGGWNYGNKAVFGKELLPLPGPTGLALLALATSGPGGRSRAVDSALGYLTRTLPEVNSPVSLGWGVLGLRAWGATTEEHQDRLQLARERSAGRADAAPGLGLILMAAAENGPAMLGLHGGKAVSTGAGIVPDGRRDDGGAGR
jgi:hypothetical protein